jgi:hypothetical protein
MGNMSGGLEQQQFGELEGSGTVADQGAGGGNTGLNYSF